MFCEKCGHPVSDDARFCAGCGQSVAGAARTGPPPPGSRSERPSPGAAPGLPPWLAAPEPAASSAAPAPAAIALRWKGGNIHVGATELAVTSYTGDGEVTVAIPYKDIRRVHIDRMVREATTTLNVETDVLQAYEGCAPEEAVRAVPGVLRSAGVRVDERRFLGQLELPAAARPPLPGQRRLQVEGGGFPGSPYDYPRRYGAGRRAIYGVLWSLYTSFLAIGGVATMAAGNASGLLALALGAVTGYYSYLIWTYRARRLWLLIFF